MTAFLTRLGDRVNPIVVKETRQAVQSRLVAWFLVLFLAVQLVAVLLLISGRGAGTEGLDLRAGRDMFTFVQGILLATCLILIPAMTGVRLAAERSDVNVDLMFISSLTPRAVVAGKLTAAAALALLIFSACAPFMTFAYVLRGLDVPTILVVLAADYLAVLLATTFALFLAAVPATRGMRAVLGLIAFLVMCYWGAGLVALSAEFLRYGVGLDTGTWEFWAGFGGVAGLAAGGIGLLFVWAVALLSPPAANRALPVRLYTLGLWLLTGAGFAAWSVHLGRPEPVGVWGSVGCALFSLQFAIAASERDVLGARVARRIPRSALLRVPAFFLYSGAAGGLAFGVAGAGLTVAGVAAWYAYLPSPYSRGYDSDGGPVTSLALVAAYAYCYCMTAVVFRRALTRSGFRRGFTWLVAGILFGLGCTLPYVFRYAFFDSHSRYGYPDELIALYLPNPVVMIDDATSSAPQHLALTGVFLAVWGAGVTVGNGPWLARQLADFCPPRERTRQGDRE